MIKKYCASCFFIFSIFMNVLLFSEEYSVPERTEDNIIIGSYNIKWFGQIDHNFDRLASVIQYFDVCGLIEVKDGKELPRLVTALENLTGNDWSYIMGFKTNRPEGSYYENYAAVWRTDRAAVGGGLISNIFDPSEIYRNDPYVVSFTCKNFDFTAVFVHTRWSNDDYGSRKKEIEGIPGIIAYMKEMTDERDFIIMGDFNYSGTAPAMKQMADDLEFIQIDPNVKSTFKNDLSGYSSSYDHIYISNSNTAEFIAGQSGVIDATELVYGDNSVLNMELSKKELSDHLPVWAAYSVTGPDDD